MGLENEETWYKEVKKSDAEKLEEIVMKEYDSENKPTISIIMDVVYISNPGGNEGKGFTINLSSRFIKMYAKVAGLKQVPDEIVPSLRQVLILLLTQSEWDCAYGSRPKESQMEDIDLGDDRESPAEKILRKVKEKAKVRREMLIRRESPEKVIPLTNKKDVKKAIIGEKEKKEEEKAKKKPQPLA